MSMDHSPLAAKTQSGDFPVTTQTHQEPNPAPRGRGFARGRGQWSGHSASLHPGMHESALSSATGRGRGFQKLSTPLESRKPEGLSSQTCSPVPKPKTPAPLKAQIDRLVDHSEKLNQRIPRYEEVVTSHHPTDQTVKEIVFGFSAIFHEIDDLLLNPSVSEPQKNRLRVRLRKNFSSLEFMLSRLADRSLDRDLLVFRASRHLLALNLAAEIAPETQAKLLGWLQSATNPLAYDSITHLKDRTAPSRLPLLKKLADAIRQFQFRFPEKVHYNLNYSLAVELLRAGEYRQASDAVTAACSFHNQKRLGEFLSVIKALEACQNIPLPPSERPDIPQPVYITSETMDDDTLMKVITGSLTFAQSEISHRSEVIRKLFNEGTSFNEVNGLAHDMQFAAFGHLTAATNALFQLCVKRERFSPEIARALGELKQLFAQLPEGCRPDGLNPTNIHRSLNVIDVHAGTTFSRAVYRLSEEYLAKPSEAGLAEVHKIMECLKLSQINIDDLSIAQRVMIQTEMGRVAEKADNDEDQLYWLTRWQWPNHSKEEMGRLEQIRRYYKVHQRNEEALGFEEKIQATGTPDEKRESLKRLGEIFYHQGDFDKAIEVTQALAQSDPCFYHCQMSLLMQKKNDADQAWEHLKQAKTSLENLSSAEMKDALYLYHKRMAYFLNKVADSKLSPQALKLPARILKQQALRHALTSKANAESQNEDLEKLIERLNFQGVQEPHDNSPPRYAEIC